jgi:membrane-associated phospholipid phosphatase
MSRTSTTVVMAKIARVTAVTVTVAVGLAAPGPAEAQSGVSTRSQGATVSSAMVLRWNDYAMTAIATSQIKTGGARQTRAGAMVQAAVHDALNAIDRRYEPYAIDFTAAAGASADAAVCAAAHDTLLGMFPYEQTTLDALYDALLAGIADGQSKTDGISAGQTAAAAILAARANDNSAPNTSYTYGELVPGVYQSTPPNFPAAVEPHWGEVAPFAMKYGSQFRPEGPNALNTEEYTIDFNEVKSLGAFNSTTRTLDQTEIARFWIESSPFTWNRIARIVTAAAGADAWDAGRTLALMNIAMADAFIAGFDAKYYFNFWRPVTAIRAADTDGNAETQADATWLPYGPPATPGHPDYVSTHSISGGAAAEVLASVYGDATSFTLSTSTAINGARSYASFSAASSENSSSRVYAGFHFRKACTDGRRAGRILGHYVTEHFARPVRQ